MLDLVAYDIGQPRNQRDLERGIKACAKDQRNVHYAPWFMDTPLTPSKALRTIKRNLGRDRKGKDGLLVLSLGSGVSGSCHNARMQPTAISWLKRHGVKFRPTKSARVLAVAYTLHGATRQDYTDLQNAIKREFPDYCKPVKALYFVATRLTPEQVRNKLRARLPDRKHDELLVLSIPHGTLGKCGLHTYRHNQRVRKWFKDKGVPIR